MKLKGKTHDNARARLSFCIVTDEEWQAYSMLIYANIFPRCCHKAISEAINTATLVKYQTGPKWSIRKIQINEIDLGHTIQAFFLQERSCMQKEINAMLSMPTWTWRYFVEGKRFNIFPFNQSYAIHAVMPLIEEIPTRSTVAESSEGGGKLIAVTVSLWSGYCFFRYY